MKRRMAIASVMVAGAALLSIPGGSATTPDNLPDFVIRSDVRLVLLDVSVKDREGGFVSGLSKDDFHIDENGVPQSITVFAHNDIPVTVGILVDNSLSMIPKRAEVLDSALAFISGSNPKDEIFVLNFNDTVKRGLPDGELFSDDIKQLHEALYQGRPEGRTALNDAVIEGLQQLQQGTRDKKTLILISDGGDNASRHTRAEMFKAVEESIATIYTVGLFTPGDPEQNPGTLKTLAKISGGLAYFPDPRKPQELAGVCRRIAEDIRTRYTVGYKPAESGGAQRHIRVRVVAPDRTHLTARTRTSYLYEQNPKTAAQ